MKIQLSIKQQGRRISKFETAEMEKAPVDFYRQLIILENKLREMLPGITIRFDEVTDA